jgi:hypothetical protein
LPVKKAWTLYWVVVPGDTVIEGVVAPLFQRKELPGDAVAVSVIESPTHIIPEFTDRDGIGLTFTLAVAGALHPPGKVAVTM